jgi:type II secretory pathway pseudopilin PulG
MRNYKHRSNSGFTLVETVIAMGIITIMITAFMAAFGPAVKGISRSISAKEVNRLASTLEYELSVLRPDEATTYTTAFEKAFTWIKTSGTKSDMLLMYQYRGDPTNPNSDGTLAPYTGTDGIPGKDYVLQSVVRQFSNSAVIAAELEPGILEGRVFIVKMSQLVFNNGALEVTGNPGAIQDPQNPGGGVSYTAYPEATIAFQASFYALKSSSYNYINSASFRLDSTRADGHPDDTGKPIFVRNMAVRR